MLEYIPISALSSIKSVSATDPASDNVKVLTITDSSNKGMLSRS